MDRTTRLRAWAERQSAGGAIIQWDILRGPIVILACSAAIEYRSADGQWYDADGYDADGYDADGYDADGYDADGYDADGYDARGYDADGYDANGYDANGYDADGYDADGYDADGYDADGYDADGYDADGYDADGYDADGYDADNRDRNGNCRDGDCDNCDACAQARGRIAGYHSADRSHWRSYLRRYPGPHYGIELEMWARDPQGDVGDDLPSGFIAERDGSLDSSHGVEVIGPPLPWDLAHDEHASPWAIWCRDMVRKAQKGLVKGHDAGTGYGMHIHVSRSAWDDDSHIERTVQAVNAWHRMAERVAQRKATSYCEIKPGLKKHEVSNLGRYSAVNVMPTETVEFRLFRANLRWDRLAKNLEFVHAVIEWTRCADPEGADPNAFRAWIVNPEVAPEYPHLAEYLTCAF